MARADDLEIAKAWLEHLQADAYAHYGVFPLHDELPTAVPEVRDHIRKVFDSLAVNGRMDVEGKSLGFEEYVQRFEADLVAARDACPTRFESPSWYKVLLTLTDAIGGAAKEIGVQIPHPPLFGTLHTGRVNGMAVAVPDSAIRLVLIDQGLFGFANLMAKVVASAFPFVGDREGLSSFSSDPEDVARNLEQRSEITERFLDALVAYVVEGHPHFARPYAIPHAMHLAAPLRESMELFIVGHEIAHVALGHLEGNAVRRAVADTVEADEIETSWKQEVSADALGMTLMVRAMLANGFDLSLSFWGADLFFGCIDAVERAVCLLTSGADPGRQVSKTHPPAVVRREVLRNVLASAVKEPESAKAALQLATVVETTLGYVWQRSIPVLARMHADGVRPKRWWTERLAAAAAS